MRVVFIFVFVLSGYQCVMSAEPTCGDNEDDDDCPVDCPSDYCPKSAGENQACPESDVCPPSECKCRINYRRADNGTCIPTRNCPPFACPKHERYNSCPAYCPTDSCADRNLNGVCPYNILILLICEPKCVCADGYYRNSTSGRCVTADQCPDEQQFSNSPTTTSNEGGSSRSSQATASASTSSSGGRSTATASAAATASR